MTQNHPYEPNCSNVETALKSPVVQRRVEELREQIRANPDHCCVPPFPYVKVQTGARRVRAWFRHLVWFCERGDVPTFAPATCGTQGCVNPAHQMSMKDYLASRRKGISVPSPMQRLSDAERRIGELEARLGVAAVHDDGSISSL